MTVKSSVAHSHGMKQIKVVYSKVASETTALKSRADAEKRRVKKEYDSIMTRFGELDGATNATVIEVGILSKERTNATASVLYKLGAFVAEASKYTENTEREIASVFNRK